MDEIPSWVYIAAVIILVFATLVVAIKTQGGIKKPLQLLVLVSITVGYIFSLVFIKDVQPQLGLDLQGGVSIVLSAQGDYDPEELELAADIIRNRVDAVGVAEPDIRTQDQNIIVDLPGADNVQEAQALIGQTAELRFRQVAENQQDPQIQQILQQISFGAAAEGEQNQSAEQSVEGESDPQNVDTSGGGPGMNRSGQEAEEAPAAESVTLQCGGTNPQQVVFTGDLTKPTPRELDKAEDPIIALDQQGLAYFLCPTILTGDIVKDAGRQVDQRSGAVNVGVTLTDEGGEQFTELIGRPLSNQLVAIVLDSVVISAPQIQPSLANGLTDNQLVITVGEQENRTEVVDELATVLRFGSLGVVLEQQTAQQVSATLGTDQLQAGLLAGAIGLLFVLIYMFLYYRVLVFVIFSGTVLLGLSMYAIVSWLGATTGLALTLAGAVGLIVSLGVTIDSYIVYFEKLKEEVKQGKTVRASLDSGFKKAYKTIIAGDIVSLIGAVVLYYLASGSVRGFAFFLGLSTLLDLIFALCFMHPLVKVMAKNDFLLNARFIGISVGLNARRAKVE